MFELTADLGNPRKLQEVQYSVILFVNPSDENKALWLRLRLRIICHGNYPFYEAIHFVTKELVAMETHVF
jgi:hypothetical protein